MAKPLKTLQRWGRLAKVFPARSGEDLAPLLASLSVLFEDLRIELDGIAEDGPGKLDELGASGRRIYFLRRAMATIHEFTNTLDELDKLQSFRMIRNRFSPVAERHWARALAYLRRHERYIARMRHHVGGHFGKQAAVLAVGNLQPDEVGSVEIALYGKGGGAKLFFASEIAAIALLRNVPGNTSVDKSRKMIRRAIVAFRHAVRAVDCITLHYLWERLG